MCLSEWLFDLLSVDLEKDGEAAWIGKGHLM